ncbi:hemerythrin domain-containing protein [Pseudoneobacillus sp. C159]
MNMSGPSLKLQSAHSMIHEAALNEAKELKELLRRALNEGNEMLSLQITEVVIEHWESRTLKHAEAEEEGLYKEILEENPEQQTLISQLTRDHDIMRRIVGQMKALLANGKASNVLLSLIDALLIVDEIHNEDEMNKLLTGDKHKHNHLQHHEEELDYGS